MANRWQMLVLMLAPSSWGPRSPWGRFRQRVREADVAIYEEIRARRADPAAAERGDVMSLLLQARDEDGEPLSDRELRDELVTLLVAGHETTATSLAWTLERITRHPEVLARLEDDPDGEYLDAVIKESLRLRPVVPAVARKLTEPVELGGHLLPAGVFVVPSIYLTHRRARHLSRPARVQARALPREPAVEHGVPAVRRRRAALPRRELRAVRDEDRARRDPPARADPRGRAAARADHAALDHVRAVRGRPDRRERRMSPRRLTRAEQREKTRTCLVEAAAKVFSRRGYDKASLDEVAEEAGFTKGAVYSNFKGKEDLFLATIDAHFEQRLESVKRVMREEPDEQGTAHAAGMDFMNQLNADPEYFALFFEFWAYAQRNPAVKRKFLPRVQRFRSALAELFEAKSETGSSCRCPSRAARGDADRDGRRRRDGARARPEGRARTTCTRAMLQFFFRGMSPSRRSARTPARGRLGAGAGAAAALAAGEARRAAPGDLARLRAALGLELQALLERHPDPVDRRVAVGQHRLLGEARRAPRRTRARARGARRRA